MEGSFHSQGALSLGSSSFSLINLGWKIGRKIYSCDLCLWTVRRDLAFGLRQFRWPWQDETEQSVANMPISTALCIPIVPDRIQIAGSFGDLS